MEIFNLKSSDLPQTQKGMSKKSKQAIAELNILTNNHKYDTLDESASSEAPGFLVTAIKPSVKTENRVNVFIDERFDFSLEIPQVVDLKLKVGRRLSEHELVECRHASEFGKLYRNTLEYTLTRPHSVKEIRDHLVRKRINRKRANFQAVKNRKRTREDRIKFHLRTTELPLFTDEDIEQVINRLIEKKYLHDEQFAKFYVENRFYKKGISEKRLRQELQRKGIDNSIIEQVLTKNPRDATEEIRKIIKRKQGKYSNDRLISYLVRQGFDYQIAKAVVHETDSQNLE